MGATTPLIMVVIKMILEDATFDTFGYYARDLKPQSGKPILAACDDCGIVRETSKDDYHPLCNSCAKKGNTYCLEHIQTEEHKRKRSEALKGRALTEKHKHNMSEAVKGDKHPNFGKRGKDANGYKGGRKLTKARFNARRKRDLGYIPLNSYFEGCEGHHITHNFVIYIPKGVHKNVWHNLNTGQGMEAINTLALDFLVN